MPFCRAAAEPLGEAVEELNGKGDFRKQNERLPVATECFRYRLEIGFGLARTRHTIEQRYGKAFARHSAQQRSCGGLLLQIKSGRPERRIGTAEGVEFWKRCFGERPGFDEPANYRRRDIGFLGKRR